MTRLLYLLLFSALLLPIVKCQNEDEDLEVEDEDYDVLPDEEPPMEDDEPVPNSNHCQTLTTPQKTPLSLCLFF